MASTKEIVRFAPSPTGYLHVGGARTALFNWLWAKHTGGEFHLRIEDTDQARLVKDAEEQIKESLEWLGLKWDGPIVHQSKRVKDDVYLEYAKQLIKSGWAYVADESEEELKEVKNRQKEAIKAKQPLPPYPSREKNIPFEKFKSGKGMVIRFMWPDEPKAMDIEYFNLSKDPWTTHIDPKTSPSSFEDFVLIKSDGFPTYNFSHVIDDHELGVTRIIRGDEFTSSLNKYVALHEAFGWKHPNYNHVPPILGKGDTKLSKRDGAKDLLEYQKEGYLPEAIANFISLIGWRPKGEQELFFSLDELAQAFSLEGIQKSPGKFDPEKLDWMNGEHLKQKGIGEVIALAEAGSFWKSTDEAYDTKVLGLALERVKTLADLKAVRGGFFYKKPNVTKEKLVGGENPETIGVWLEKTQRQLEALPEKDWTTDQVKDELTDVLEEEGLVPKQLYPVLREALTAEPQTPAIWEIMGVLGKKETLERLESAASLVA
ncbi:glutamate--tRNA ligase [Patescibacteria group bacterium]|nr:glutamate--tRNA ligase [Patescibacteria group bacterium]